VLNEVHEQVRVDSFAIDRVGGCCMFILDAARSGDGLRLGSCNGIRGTFPQSSIKRFWRFMIDLSINRQLFASITKSDIPYPGRPPSGCWEGSLMMHSLVERSPDTYGPYQSFVGRIKRMKKLKHRHRTRLSSCTSPTECLLRHGVLR
jgi:hypothetical protein